jgi:hypothetical protein
MQPAMTTAQPIERSWPPGRRMLGSPLPALRRIGVVMHATRDGDDRDAARLARPRARSLVLSAAEPIELRLRALSSPLELEIDGHERSAAHPLTRLRIDQTAPCCRLIRLGPRSFPQAA